MMGLIGGGNCVGEKPAFLAVLLEFLPTTTGLANVFEEVVFEAAAAVGFPGCLMGDDGTPPFLAATTAFTLTLGFEDLVVVAPFFRVAAADFVDLASLKNLSLFFSSSSSSAPPS